MPAHGIPLDMDSCDCWLLKIAWKFGIKMRYSIFFRPNFNFASLKERGQRGTWRCFAISCSRKKLKNFKKIFSIHLSDIVCKQLRVIFLFLWGQIGWKVVEGHLGWPLGESEENAGESSMRLVPGPGDGVHLPLQGVTNQDGLHRNPRKKGSRSVVHQGSPGDCWHEQE